MLSGELAGEIVQETMLRLNRNINMMDDQGYIIASGDSSRIGQYHAAAAEAIHSKSMLIVDEHNAERWEGAQPGVNVPISFNRTIVGAFGISGKPEEVEPFIELVKLTAELMIKQNQLKLHDEWKQMSVDLILEELFRWSSPNMVLIEQRLEALRIRLKPPYIVAVVSFGSWHEQRDREKLADKINRLPGLEQTLVSQLRLHRYGLLLSGIAEQSLTKPLQRLQELAASYSDQAAIGVSSAADKLEAVRLAYYEAEQALRFGGQSRKQPIIHYRDVVAQALVSKVPADYRNHLSHRIIPLLTDKMKDTLHAYFKCSLNAAEAALKLGIHRNTMLYRLEQIRSVTGYDPNHFHDAILLQMALWLSEC
jgi:carbohydrate diacid regulator